MQGMSHALFLYCDIFGSNSGESFSAQGLVWQLKHVCEMVSSFTVVGSDSGESLSAKGSVS